MKVNIDIDCTPEEARTFLGLPDVKPMQSVLMEEIQNQMLGNLKAMDAEHLFSTWLPATIKGWEQMMTMFQGQMTKMASKKDDAPEK